MSVVLVVGLAGALGCEDGEPEPNIAARDSAGITIVESIEPLWGEGEGWQVAAEPLVTIGSADGADEESLHHVRGTLRLDDGRIVVANSGSDELRFYNPDGSYHSAAGRAGAGPGEFDTIARMWRVGDSLFVYDFQQGNRVSVFADDGEYVRSFRLKPTHDARVPVDADGFNTGHVLVQLSGGRTQAREGLAFDLELFLVYSAVGEPVDTIGWLPGSEAYFVALPGVIVAGLDRPFGLALQWAMGNGGMYFGSGKTYEIGWYNTSGELKRLFKLPVPNPRLTDEERSTYESERSAEYVGSAPVFRRLLDMVELPETKPAYGRLVVDSDGNLWVAEYRRQRQEMDRWNVLGVDGWWLGTVVTPPGVEIYEIGRDYVLGVRRDDFEVEYIQLHELSRGEAD